MKKIVYFVLLLLCACQAQPGNEPAWDLKGIEAGNPKKDVNLLLPESCALYVGYSLTLITLTDPAATLPDNGDIPPYDQYWVQFFSTGDVFLALSHFDALVGSALNIVPNSASSAFVNCREQDQHVVIEAVLDGEAKVFISLPPLHVLTKSIDAEINFTDVVDEVTLLVNDIPYDPLAAYYGSYDRVNDFEQDLVSAYHEVTNTCVADSSTVLKVQQKRKYDNAVFSGALEGSARVDNKKGLLDLNPSFEHEYCQAYFLGNDLLGGCRLKNQTTCSFLFENQILYENH